MKAEIRADKGFCFGAARLVGAGVSVRAIVDRFLAGESVVSIAEDYEIVEAAVEDCLRYRLQRKPYRTKMGARPVAQRSERPPYKRVTPVQTGAGR